MKIRQILTTLAACWAAGPLAATGEPYPSTYEPLPSGPVLIVNATLLTGTGTRLDNASMLIADGRIQAIAGVAENIDSGGVDIDSAQLIDAGGRWVTPGLIDVHSHLGVYASPNVKAHSDGNEATSN